MSAIPDDLADFVSASMEPMRGLDRKLMPVAEILLDDPAKWASTLQENLESQSGKYPIPPEAVLTYLRSLTEVASNLRKQRAKQAEKARQRREDACCRPLADEVLAATEEAVMRIREIIDEVSDVLQVEHELPTGDAIALESVDENEDPDKLTPLQVSGWSHALEAGETYRPPTDAERHNLILDLCADISVDCRGDVFRLTAQSFRQAADELRAAADRLEAEFPA